MINTILWDVDGTLLDFTAAEKAAIKTLFREFNLGQCSDEMIKRYSETNKTYWQRLESSVAEDFNSLYQLYLGDTIVYHDDSLEIVKSLQGRVRQYVVSNGTVEAQLKKLRLSGLGELMDGIFLSEHIGVEKPNIEFFDRVFEEIGSADRSSILIAGDSLTSDIQGGNNAGIVTCWYNPQGDKAPDKYRIDYEISDLHQIYEFL